MKKLRTYLIFAFLLCFLTAGFAQTPEQKAHIAELYSQLTKAKSPDDSIKIYYDILDLSPRKDYRDLATKVWGTASRAGRTDVQLEIARQLTAAVKTDSVFKVIEDAVGSLPESEEQKETVLFIRMKRISYKSRYSTEEEKQKEVSRMMASYEKNAHQDKYSRLLELFSLVEYLRNDVPGDLLQNYIDDLFDLGTSSEFSLYAIPNIIYAESANTYTLVQEHARAVQADRKMLDIISGLEKKYADMGRKYRNYDVSRYVSCRRMLQNYEALAPGEAEQIYAEINRLAATNPEVKADLERNPLAKAYYNMATENYTAAIPLLDQLYQSVNEVSRKRRVLELMIKAAEKTGNDSVRLNALDQYKDVIEEYTKLKATERYRELQLRYDLKTLKERNSSLELDSVNSQIASERKIMLFVTVSFVILLIAFILTLFYWRRFRKNTYRLGYIVNRLSHERDRMRHTLFYDSDMKLNFAAEEDRVPTFEEWCEKRKSLFIHEKNVSTKMTQSLINDLLMIAFLGKNDRMAHISPVSVDEVMRIAVTRAYENGGARCKISVTYPEDDYTINSDMECLSQVIGQILGGMAAHESEGDAVMLESRLTADGNIEFIFTAPKDFTLHEDTASYKPIITAAEMADGRATGMFINRTIALLLESDIKSDSSFRDGARFIFTTPADLK